MKSLGLWEQALTQIEIRDIVTEFSSELNSSPTFREIFSEFSGCEFRINLTEIFSEFSSELNSSPTFREIFSEFSVEASATGGDIIGLDTVAIELGGIALTLI